MVVDVGDGVGVVGWGDADVGDEGGLGEGGVGARGLEGLGGEGAELTPARGRHARLVGHDGADVRGVGQQPLAAHADVVAVVGLEQALGVQHVRRPLVVRDPGVEVVHVHRRRVHARVGPGHRRQRAHGVAVRPEPARPELAHGEHGEYSELQGYIGGVRVGIRLARSLAGSVDGKDKG